MMIKNDDTTKYENENYMDGFGTLGPGMALGRVHVHCTLCIYLGFNLSFWSILGVLGNWGRLCPFDMIFSANGSVFRAEHDPLLRTAYFLSKTRVLRVRKRCSTLNLEAR